MTEHHPRHRWLLAAGAAACLGLAGCSGSSTPSAASPSDSASVDPGPRSAGPAHVADARPALHRSVVATSALRSYAFSSRQTVTGGASTQVTRLSGRALRPAAVAYTLVTGGQTQQVVRLGSVTYRRVPPGRFRRLVKPTPPVDPLATVTRLLGRLTGVTSSPTASGTSFAGSLSGADATAIGVIGNATAGAGLSIPITVQVDQRGRVTRLELTAPLQAGSRRLSLRQVTTYTGFNAQPAIPRPR